MLPHFPIKLEHLQEVLYNFSPSSCAFLSPKAPSVVAIVPTLPISYILTGVHYANFYYICHVIGNHKSAIRKKFLCFVTIPNLMPQ